MTKPVLLAISGSLRRDSYRTAILTALVEAVSDRVEVRLPPLRDVPTEVARFVCTGSRSG